MENENTYEQFNKFLSETITNFSTKKGKVAPIVEGYIKLTKEMITDEEAERRLVNLEDSGKDEIKTIIVVDGILKRLKNQHQRNEIKKLLNSKKSLDEITERAVVYLAENKRSHNGDVLYQLNALPQKTRRDFQRKIKKIRPNQVYINGQVSDYLKSNEKRFKRNRIIKYSIIGAISLGLLISGYLIKKNYRIKIYKIPKITKTESEPKEPEKPKYKIPITRTH